MTPSRSVSSYRGKSLSNLSDFSNRIKAAPVSAAIHITDVVYKGGTDNTEAFWLLLFTVTLEDGWIAKRKGLKKCKRQHLTTVKKRENGKRNRELGWISSLKDNYALLCSTWTTGTTNETERMITHRESPQQMPGRRHTWNDEDAPSITAKWYIDNNCQQ